MGNRPETPLGKRRRQLVYSALEFSRLLQKQLPELNEGRLFRIETGRANARPEERAAIAQLLGCRPWEVQQ